ncbi:MAG: 2-dehydropantoate 2-reductase [Deferribacterales bacterium]
MKIVCFGAGAIGSFFCGLMGRNHDVELIARGSHLHAMEKTGKLFIKSYKFGDLVVNVKAFSKPQGIYDIVFISTKSQDTEAACVALKDHIKEGSIIVSLQNGVDNPYIIKKYFPNNKIVAGSVFVGLSINPPGQVNHTAEGKVVIGAIDNSTTKDDLFVIKKLFDEIDIPCTITDNIKYIAWKKLLWNLVFNPLSALLESTCGRLVDSPYSKYIMDKMLEEGVRAAATQGVNIEKEYLERLMDVNNNLYNYKTSMLQDIEKLKIPEVDGIMLPVIEKLKNAGSSAPYTETVYNLLKFKYGKPYIYTPKPTVDVIVYNSNNEIVLIERKNPPYGWAIPGGFIDYGETVEQAARRELLEETGIKVDELHLLGIYSSPKRDPRFHTISTVYYTFSDQQPIPQDDAKDARFFSISSLPEQIAFDHKEIIEDFKKIMRV